ncbi:MAG: 4'-phosphopantetheinyl transferase family protein [Bacteroidia bacterium]
MPVLFTQQIYADTVLGVWNITEQKPDLLKLIGDNWNEHSQRVDHLHWLASRAMVKDIFPKHEIEIVKDNFNKPHLKVDGRDFHISITHSGSFAAVFISETKNVGIDMEKIDQRIVKIKHKFMRDDKFDFIRPGEEAEIFTVIWAAKETMYKYYGKRELDFRKNLRIEPFVLSGDFELNGTIQKNNYFENLKIHVRKIEGYVLTFVC